MNRLFILALVLLGSSTLYASEQERFFTKVELPSRQTVVVAEGDFEARSTGSFSVRLYDAASPGDETTFFSDGQIRSRDGTIEKIMLANITGDSQPEIVVIVRSAGTGGYLSAHAFTTDEQRLTFSAAVEDLPPNADPITALKLTIEKHKGSE